MGRVSYYSMEVPCLSALAVLYFPPMYAQRGLSLGGSMNFTKAVFLCVYEVASVVVLYTMLVCCAFVLHYIVRLDP